MNQAIVHVVPTLHQYHAAAPGYGFDALTGVLQALRPDVLVVELTESAVRTRRPQLVKREYPQSVFPYAQRHGVPMVAMEPDEDHLFSELATRAFEAEQQFRARWPQRYAQNEAAIWAFFNGLFESAASPAAFDSEEVDRFIERKHARDNELFGAPYRDAWERWNEHLARTIARIAQAGAHRRIVALAGIEHGYWLRPQLDRLAGSSGTWLLAPRLAELAQVAP